MKDYISTDADTSKWLSNSQGKIVYSDVKLRTVSSIAQLKGDKFNEKLFFRNIKIKSSLTKGEYQSKDYINQKIYSDTKEIHPKDYKIRIMTSADGKGDFLVFNITTEAIANILVHCLTKYYLQSKSFNYYSEKADDQYIVLIGCPKSNQGYDDLISGITEFFSDIRFYFGVISRGAVIDDRSKKEEKTFSSGVASAIVGGSYLLISNPIRVELLKKLFISNFRNKTLADKLLKLIQSDPNLIYVNIGPGSFFMDLDKVPQVTKNYLLKLYKREKSVSIDDPRTRTDYTVKAIVEKKDLLNYSDTDPITALAHEYGHYCVKRNPFLNKLQGNRLLMRLAKMSGFQIFVSGILGLYGKTTWATIVPIIMSSPVLISEFAASYYGLKTLKGLGATEDDLRAMKRDMSAAFGTYFHSTLKRAAIGMTIGGISTNIRSDKMKIKTFSSGKKRTPEEQEKLDKDIALNLKKGAVASGITGAVVLGTSKLGSNALKKMSKEAISKTTLPASVQKTSVAGKSLLGASAALGALSAYKHHKNKKKYDKK